MLEELAMASAGEMPIRQDDSQLRIDIGFEESAIHK